MLLKFPALSAGIPDALLLILFSEELKLLFCDKSAYGSHGIQFPPTFSIEPRHSLRLSMSFFITVTNNLLVNFL